MSGQLEIRGHETFVEIGARDWNRLVTDDAPILDFAWLLGMEISGCVGGETGWTPTPISVWQRGRLVGAAPVFGKSHSMGELIYDFGWAQAVERMGREYYPKLVVTNPFTPISGRKLLVDPELPESEQRAVRLALCAGLQQIVRSSNATSAHVLFTHPDDQAALAAAGFAGRITHQYHWHRRGDATFEDFIGRMRSKDRREIRRERRHVAAAGYRVVATPGEEVDEAQIRRVYDYYAATCDKYPWGHAHLTESFFVWVRDLLPQRLLVFEAHDAHGEPVAGTFDLRVGKALYGRHWGTTLEVPYLHFETCLYAMIEYAMAHGYERIEPGAGGEHKLHRGYEPVPIHSSHWFRAPDLQRMFERHLERERELALAQIEELRQSCPGAGPGEPDPSA
jgi:predicted N-acyltransferase